MSSHENLLTVEQGRRNIDEMRWESDGEALDCNATETLENNVRMMLTKRTS